MSGRRGLPLSGPADDLAAGYTDDYARDLILVAKERAYKDGATAVETPHIFYANEVINRRRRQSTWAELGLLMGGALVGAGVQGGITESAAGRQLMGTVYVVVGLLGLILFFITIKR